MPPSRTTFGQWLRAALLGWACGVGLITLSSTYFIAYPLKPADAYQWTNPWTDVPSIVAAYLGAGMYALFFFSPFALAFSGVVTTLLFWTGWPATWVGWWAACLFPVLCIALLPSVQ
ncbi:hypothetical protein [Alienimonas sp. DA493]|uniref:hypothetical protein n=1 Tax=Alienimonas sp. DA493 TaxID=3373605 RepID=UPI003754C83E